MKLIALEVWRPCPGFEQFYEVSSLGRIRRLVAGGKYAAGTLITPSYQPVKDYATVTLSGGGKRAWLRLNRLVCEAFHGPAPSPIHEAAHGDGNRKNNASANLRWATPLENADDKRKHGTIFDAKGDRNPYAKLTSEQVAALRAEYATGLKGSVLGPKYGVSARQAWAIGTGRAWKL